MTSSNASAALDEEQASTAKDGVNGPIASTTSSERHGQRAHHRASREQRPQRPGTASEANQADGDSEVVPAAENNVPSNDNEHDSDAHPHVHRQRRHRHHTNNQVLSLDDISNMSAMRQSQLSAQVEEMAELNRAILMSLRDSDQTNTGQSSGNLQTSNYVPSESDIELLIMMGFEREASVRALKRNGGDVERAADHLLSS
jgi:NACalpha-BTF3-like transcription factor